eukprot:397535_1
MKISGLLFVFCTLLISLFIGSECDGANDRRRRRRTRHQDDDKYISLDSFPNPVTETGIELCGRGRESFICDPNQFINMQQADEIDDIILNATKSKLVFCGGPGTIKQ